MDDLKYKFGEPLPWGHFPDARGFMLKPGQHFMCQSQGGLFKVVLVAGSGEGTPDDFPPKLLLELVLHPEKTVMVTRDVAQAGFILDISNYFYPTNPLFRPWYLAFEEARAWLFAENLTELGMVRLRAASKQAPVTACQAEFTASAAEIRQIVNYEVMALHHFVIDVNRSGWNITLPELTLR